MLVPTPLGNLGDMTTRAMATLRAADLLLCEDTRVTARLCAAYGIEARLSPLHDHNEESRIADVLALVRAGKRVAVVSDAGTPLVSDPGFRLVRAAIAEGLPVAALPGPNAAVLALVLSGLPPLPFLALGFPPPKQAARRAAFAAIRAAERAGLSATLVWYEAPHRLAETLSDLLFAFGDRPAAVGARTDQAVRGGASRPLSRSRRTTPSTRPRGEISVVVGPPPEEATPEAGPRRPAAGGAGRREPQAGSGTGDGRDRAAAAAGVRAGAGDTACPACGMN